MFLGKKFYLCDKVKYCPIYTYLLECELMVTALITEAFMLSFIFYIFSFNKLCIAKLFSHSPCSEFVIRLPGCYDSSASK